MRAPSSSGAAAAHPANASRRAAAPGPCPAVAAVTADGAVDEDPSSVTVSPLTPSAFGGHHRQQYRAPQTTGVSTTAAIADEDENAALPRQSSSMYNAVSATSTATGTAAGFVAADGPVSDEVDHANRTASESVARHLPDPLARQVGVSVNLVFFTAVAILTSIVVILQLLMIVLKLDADLQQSWDVVLAPTWVGAALALIAVFAYAFGDFGLGDVIKPPDYEQDEENERRFESMLCPVIADEERRQQRGRAAPTATVASPTVPTPTNASVHPQAPSSAEHQQQQHSQQQQPLPLDASHSPPTGSPAGNGDVDTRPPSPAHTGTPPLTPSAAPTDRESNANGEAALPPRGSPPSASPVTTTTTATTSSGTGPTWTSTSASFTNTSRNTSIMWQSTHIVDGGDLQVQHGGAGSKSNSPPPPTVEGSKGCPVATSSTHEGGNDGSAPVVVATVLDDVQTQREQPQPTPTSSKPAFNLPTKLTPEQYEEDQKYLDMFVVRLEYLGALGVLAYVLAAILSGRLAGHPDSFTAWTPASFVIAFEVALLIARHGIAFRGASAAIVRSNLRVVYVDRLSIVGIMGVKILTPMLRIVAAVLTAINVNAVRNGEDLPTPWMLALATPILVMLVLGCVNSLIGMRLVWLNGRLVKDIRIGLTISVIALVFFGFSDTILALRMDGTIGWPYAAALVPAMIPWLLVCTASTCISCFIANKQVGDNEDGDELGQDDLSAGDEPSGAFSDAVVAISGNGSYGHPASPHRYPPRSATYAYGGVATPTS